MSHSDLHASPAPRSGLKVLDEPASTAMFSAGASEEETQYRLHRRFDRLGRLYGDGAVARLMGSKVIVFGLGGVGGFAAEALARSAVGHLTLVDFDDVCVTNSNRQIQALKGNVGKSKATLLAERLRLVNPQAKVEAIQSFYNAERSAELLKPLWPTASGEYDFVIDCIDNMTAKAHLIATCKARGIPLISSMGAAGKMDPTRIKLADLSKTYVCPLARELRAILRERHGFPEKGKLMGITAVYSDEKRHWPRELTYDNGMGFSCVCPKKSDEHSCEKRNLIDGTAVFVTGAFGLAAGSHVINTLVGDLAHSSPPAKDRRGNSCSPA